MMKKREGAILGAFTGILCGKFVDLHEYVEEIMERPVWTHEFPKISEELKEKSKSDFLALCENQED